ncbi:hypothetical protein [Shewanella sp. SR44-3]|uniref:hypothetical protein n=1 Tax=unclassified Shewanella TaxID=196818 RepID=UPI0015FCA960|nr:hypothetical protein [Shewanella sp. SR44-3]MBB1270791.1 hypothetical protein [Shewanella sp. SR44-3]
MKKVIFCALALSLVGCKSTDIRSIADSVSDIASIGADVTSTSGTSLPRATSVAGYEHQTQQYSNKSEPVYVTQNTKLAQERGAIRSIKHEKNPKGMTMVRFVAFHQDSGAAMESDNYLYAQDSNGWLSEKFVVSYSTKATMINSGHYYLKSDADGNNKFYTTGMIKLDKGVTNVVTIELQ